MWTEGSDQHFMAPLQLDQEAREVNSKKLVLDAILLAKVKLSRDVFLSVSWMSQLKHLLLKVFFVDVLKIVVLEQPSHTVGQSGAIA